MLDIVRATLSRHGMLPPGSRVIAAVSGGADSTCLLHTLRELGAPVAGVAHVNHLLRGQESDEDEEFVATITNKMRLPCFIRREASPPGGNLEQSLRRIRGKFFSSLVAGQRATHVALGHTQDDQAETVLFRLLRGSGITGLAGILPVTAEGLIRPLLDVTHQQTTAFLRERKLPWREDSSNPSLRFRRNRLRHQLLPQLRQDWNPQLTTRLAQLAALAYQEEREWAGQVARAAAQSLRFSAGAVEADLTQFLQNSLAVQRRLLRFATKQALGHLRGLGFGHIERILDLANQVRGTGRIQAPGLEVRRSFDWLRISPPGEPTAIETRAVRIPGVYPLPGGYLRLGFERGEPHHPCDTLKESVAAMQLELRGWRPGDQCAPVGSRRTRKLHDLFQDARIPSWRRSSWPILSIKNGSEIIWTRMFGPGQEYSEANEAAGAVRIREEENSLA